MHHFAFRAGELFCEDIPVSELATQYGTPLYIYSASTMLENYRRLDSAFAGVDHLICYAVKANSNIHVLRLLAAEGAGFDIVSGGELHRVLAAGGDAGRATFAGVGKSVAEVEAALQAGVYSMNVESEAELERIQYVASRLGVTAPVAIRVNPDVDAGTHEFISTGKSHNKFGIGIDRAAEVYRYAAKQDHLQVRGVQTHIGSQILKAEPFAIAIQKVADLVQQLKADYSLEFFSIGGGIGVAYEDALASGEQRWWESGPGQDFLTPETYANTLLPILEPLGLRVLLEPGRFISGNAGILVSRVEYIKSTPTKRFTILDAAMNDLIRPALYSGYHEAVPVALPSGSVNQVSTDLVGPVCESGDFFAKDIELPGMESGDLLALMTAGAYGAVMGSTYNTRPLPPEVLVQGEQKRLIRRRQSYDDLLALEVS